MVLKKKKTQKNMGLFYPEHELFRAASRLSHWLLAGRVEKCCEIYSTEDTQPRRHQELASAVHKGTEEGIVPEEGKRPPGSVDPEAMGANGFEEGFRLLAGVLRLCPCGQLSSLRGVDGKC